jgi:cyclopropane fatty-acyl-phospholipid synthase-like methyltransferase
MGPDNEMQIRAKHRSEQADSTYDGEYFDRQLHRHHWFTNNAAKRVRRWREILRMLQPGPEDSILDIGCGAGEHAIPLAALAREVVGIDRSFSGIRRALEGSIQQRKSDLFFAVGDARALPLAAFCFDKVAAIDFVEHVVDSVLERAFAEVYRVLRPNGMFAIYTPCATHYVERLKSRNLLLRQIPGHVAVRGPEAYVRMLDAAGFAVRSCTFAPSDYPVFGLVDRALAQLRHVGPWFRFRICIVAEKRT